MQARWSFRAAVLLSLSLPLSFSWAAGTPSPTGPVEVKPHPCRVPGSDQEMLCATYPVWENRETRQGRKIGHSDVPVLLISGERDSVTPPEFADHASRFMTNRLHVVLPRGSHGGSGECIDNLIRDFTDRASVQGLDPSCAMTVDGPTRFMKP
jgi:pimeloyl-ACP methyl ester carboxylesterase